MPFRPKRTIRSRSSRASQSIGGHRFEGLLPPVVSAPTFSIRRRASRLIPLDDYVHDGIMTESQGGLITQAISRRLNIVVAGGRQRQDDTRQCRHRRDRAPVTRTSLGDP